MRVLCVGNRYPPHSEGGYELVWQGAVRALRAAGHDVRVLTSDVTGPAPAGAPEEDAGVHRELQGWWAGHDFLRPMSPRRRLRRERHTARALARHLAEHRPDVVAWWPMGGLSLGMLEQVRRAGLPAVAFVIDDWLVYGPHADQWMRLARRFGAARIPDGDAVRWLFVSETTRQAALATGLRLARTEVVPIGIDALFQERAPERPWSGRLLYVGRIDGRKGIDMAIRALAELGDDSSLTMVGDGHPGHRQELETLAAALGVRARVEMLPGCPHAELPAVYASHDSVLFPVRWAEPWGLVPLEAMGIGRPVVASGRGGSGEYLRDGENCLLADPDVPGQIAAAVARLAGDETLRERLRAGGIQTAAVHTAERFEARVVEVLEAEADA